MSRSPRVVAFLDALQQVAEVTLEHHRRGQLLAQAGRLYLEAATGRDDRAALLLAVEERAGLLSAEARRAMLETVAIILRDQVSFDEGCLDIMKRRHG